MSGRFPRLGLHRRVAVFVSSILLGVFVAFGYISWEAVGRSTESTMLERQATARAVARHLDDLIGHARAHLGVIAAEVASAAGPLDEERARAVLEGSLAHAGPLFSRLHLVDAKRTVRVSVPAGPPLTFGPTSEQAVDAAWRERRELVSDLVSLSSDGSPGVLFVVPMERAGTVVLALVAEMPLPHPSVSAFARGLELGRTGHLEVLDGTGRVLTSTANTEIGDVTEHPSFFRPFLAERVSGIGRAAREGPVAVADVEVLAFVPLANAPWGVTVGQDERETFAIARELRERTLAAAAVALAVALALTWMGTRTVVRPLLQLTAAAERMAAGDLSEPIRVRQPDEVGRLARVLEGMRRRLAENIAELTAWSRELEQRVAERTRAYEAANEERARLEAARRVDALRDEFVASVSHELRTPLGVIKGNATTLLREDVAWPAAERRACLRAIDEECDRLVELIDILLDTARAHAGRLPIRRSATDVEAVLRRSVERSAAALAGRPIELAVRPCAPLDADGRRLEQVLANLLENAAKYSPEGAPVEVRLEPDADGVTMSVHDRGIGVPEADLARIFEPFYRVATGALPAAEGAGLGLAVCRAIVEAHGGRIWAERRPDGGTSVFLRLPRDGPATAGGEGDAEA